MAAKTYAESAPNPAKRHDTGLVTVFLGGDVMTGRGIDQILPHAGNPRIYEPYMRSARGYVELAERVNGPITQPVNFAYIWGDALEILAQRAPDINLINLETAVTASDDYWPGKGINYRMHPDNVHCLSAAGIDCCVLANNHVLDWGYPGLKESLSTLQQAGMKTAGAGQDLAAAGAPAVFEIIGKGRVLVFAWGDKSSGIPREWAAQAQKPGINLLENFSDNAVSRIAEHIRAFKRPGDIAIVSIHWGGNWGYRVPREQRSFARRLIDTAAIDLVHGHSSHHPKGIEVYKNRLILYGCGDLLNDYEGIRGQEQFRGDLTLMYFADLDAASGRLVRLEMTPLRIQRLRLNQAGATANRWLQNTLDRECRHFGCRVELREPDILRLHWDSSSL